MRSKSSSEMKLGVDYKYVKRNGKLVRINKNDNDFEKEGVVIPMSAGAFYSLVAATVLSLTAISLIAYLV